MSRVQILPPRPEFMDYKYILDQLPDLIYVTLPDGINAIFFNKSWYEYTGLTEQEALKAWANVVDPRDRERVGKVIAEAVIKRESYEVEVRLKDGRTGNYKWFLSKARPIYTPNGSLEGYVGTSIDINDRKLSIRDMEAVYEQVIEQRQQKIRELEEELEIHKTNK
jgi:PAS domain S-box-containing protein